jgi:serine protease 56
MISQERGSRGAIAKITETLGALNTLGRYLVDMTRKGTSTNVSAPVIEGSVRPDRDVNAQQPKPTEDLGGAIYTLSKNVLGPNVTDTIAPLVSYFKAT